MIRWIKLLGPHELVAIVLALAALTVLLAILHH